MIELTKARFDVALALHACGNATDTAMAAAALQRAAYVAVPCCIGKLKFSIASGSSFHPDRLTWTPRYVGARAAVCTHCMLTCRRATCSSGVDRDMWMQAMAGTKHLESDMKCSATRCVYDMYI